jgi:hypothetical protein
MQTFLPYADFNESAKVLDRQRLGKQRIEGTQIIKILCGKQVGNGWRNHPAVKMWQGYELALSEYIFAMCDEWTSRGYKDTCKDKVKDIVKDLQQNYILPYWFGNKNFHRSHKSNLIRKKQEYYGELWPDVPSDLEYIWPTSMINKKSNFELAKLYHSLNVSLREKPSIRVSSKIAGSIFSSVNSVFEPIEECIWMENYDK